MRHFPDNLNAIVLSLLAALLVAAWPAQGNAANLSFQNKMKGGIYIESASVIRGRVIRDRPLYIDPAKKGVQMNVPPGPRIIYVYDALMPGRLLFQGKFPVLNVDLKFKVVPVKGNGPLRAQIVPAP